MRKALALLTIGLSILLVGCKGGDSAPESSTTPAGEIKPTKVEGGKAPGGGGGAAEAPMPSTGPTPVGK